jgi:uncharacterized protein
MKTNEEIEVRSFEGSDIVIEERDGGPKAIVGYAIVFGQRSQNLGGFFEVIDERALAKTDMSDVVAVFNHDNNYILGRNSSNTLTLKQDKKGLRYEIPYDEQDPDHVRLMRKIQRGDVKGSSFKFSIARQGDEWEEEKESGAYVRTVTNISRLYDVGPVVNPAYLQTTASKRSLEEWKAEKAPVVSQRNALQRKLTILKTKFFI